LHSKPPLPQVINHKKPFFFAIKSFDLLNVKYHLGFLFHVAATFLYATLQIAATHKDTLFFSIEPSIEPLHIIAAVPHVFFSLSRARNHN
jgi:hypothetical protein